MEGLMKKGVEEEVAPAGGGCGCGGGVYSRKGP